MNCNECLKMLSEYCDHELDKTAAREVKAHLKKCPACRQQQRLMESMIVDAMSLTRHAPSMECLLNTTGAIHKRAGMVRRTEFGPVLDFDELADYLRVDREIIGQYIDEIPSFELGGKLLFRKKSLEAWIESKETGFRLQRTEKQLHEPSGFANEPLVIGGVS